MIKTYYNSKYTTIGNDKYCSYCGEKMKKYEDRSGCDYRETGAKYIYCVCEKALLEQEYKKEIELNHEAYINKEKEINEKYSNILTKSPKIDNIKYEYELSELNKKYDRL